MESRTLYNNIKSPRAVMIRHAKRFSIESMEHAFDALLTDEGKNAAIDYGKQLIVHSPVYLYHSPVERCRQTIEHVRKGLQSINVETTEPREIFDLGGPYIRAQWNDIVNMANTMGHEAFIRYWFDGYTDPDIIMPLSQAAKIQVQILITQLKNFPRSTHINISHDWNIMIIREYFFKQQHESIGYPDFLQGVAVYCKDNKYYLVNRDKKIELTDF